MTKQIIIILIVLLVVIPLIIAGLMYFKAQRDVAAKRKIAAKTGVPPTMSAKDQADWDDLFNNYEGITV